MNITFNNSIEAEKCVNYLNANIKPCVYEDTDGYICDYFAREYHTKLYSTFEAYMNAEKGSRVDESEKIL